MRNRCPTCDARLVLCGTAITTQQPLYCCTGLITHWWEPSQLIVFVEPEPLEVQQPLFEGDPH